MSLGFWVVVAGLYIAATILAYHLILVSFRTWRKSIGSHLTNGDAMFSAIMAVLPVGLPLAVLLTSIDGYGRGGAKWAERPYDRDR
jgi:hypothetical protein